MIITVTVEAGTQEDKHLDNMFINDRAGRAKVESRIKEAVFDDQQKVRITYEIEISPYG